MVSVIFDYLCLIMGGSRGGGRGQGVQTPPLKNHKNIGFLSSYDWSGFLKMTKFGSSQKKNVAKLDPL